MTAQTGRTNAKHIGVFLDNAAGTLTDITPYVNNVGQFGLTFDTTDVTAFNNGAKNITLGQPGAPITLSGPFDTTIQTQMVALLAAVAAGTNNPLSLDIRMGIRHAWEADEPQFGISQSAASGYLITSYMVDWNAQTWTATFDVFGATAPAFGVAAET